jgi:GAF domain-containing protein
MAALLLAVEDVNAALSHIAKIAVAVVPDGPSCGITVLKNGQPVTEVYAGSVPARVDKAQYERGDGPGLEALRTGSQVVVQDLATEDRWGDWPSTALEAATRGVYSCPLEVGGEVLGTLSLYAHEPNMFPEEVQRIAVQFARPAALLLAGVLHRISQDEVISQLHDAMSSRSVIDQAIGITMAQRRCGPEEAFGVLRRRSNDSNVKVRDVAANLVASVTAQGRNR